MYHFYVLDSSLIIKCIWEQINNRKIEINNDKHMGFDREQFCSKSVLKILSINEWLRTPRTKEQHYRRRVVDDIGRAKRFRAATQQEEKSNYNSLCIVGVIIGARVPIMEVQRRLRIERRELNGVWEDEAKERGARTRMGDGRGSSEREKE